MTDIDKKYKQRDAEALQSHIDKLESYYQRKFDYSDVVDINNKVDDFIDIINVGRRLQPNNLDIRKSTDEIREELLKDMGSGKYIEFKINHNNSTVIFKHKPYVVPHPLQRYTLELLYEAYKNQESILTTKQIFDALDKKATELDITLPESKLSHLFRGIEATKAKKNIIVTVAKGIYRINLP